MTEAQFISLGCRNPGYSPGVFTRIHAARQIELRIHYTPMMYHTQTITV